MPGYITKVLQCSVPDAQTGAASPAVYTPPIYGNPDLRPAIDDSPPLSSPLILRVQEVIGSFLYYARGIDISMLTAVNHQAFLQPNLTHATMQAANRLPAYCARYPNNALRFRACDMILHIQSDVLYLSHTPLSSRGHFLPW